MNSGAKCVDIIDADRAESNLMSVVLISVKRLSIKSPHVAWQILLYAFPLAFLVAISFWVVENYRLTPAFTLENYSELLQKRRYWSATFNSLRIGLLAPTLSVLAALPVAFALVFRFGPGVRKIIIISMLMPFFSSYVVRMFAWQIWINDQGVLASIAKLLFGGTASLNLTFTEPAVLIGLLSVQIPIATILIYLSLSRLNHTLVQASLDLGATRWQTFARVQLPFALPGMLIAFLFCFLIAFGDFVCGSILGGNQVYYLSIAIQDRVKISDWPTAAALGSIMLLLSIGVVAFMFGIFGRLPSIAAQKRD